MTPPNNTLIAHAAAYECNGEPVSADAFYAIACDPRRSVAVEACAGAGKTWMLVSRIVRALLDGATAAPGQQVLPHEILAITFTKKAAGEMRERLDDWLKAFAHADDATLLRELADARRQARCFKPKRPEGRAGRARAAIKFIPLHSGQRPLGADPHLPQLVCRLAAQRAGGGAAAAGAARQLRAAGRRCAGARAGLAAVLRGGGGDASHRADFEAVVLAHGRFQTDKALQAALDKRTEFTLADEKGVIDASVQPFGLQFPEFAGLDVPEACLAANAADPSNHRLLLEAAKALGRASAPTFSAKGVELEQALSSANMPAVFLALLTEKGTARKFGDKIAGIERIREAQDLVLRVVQACQQHDAWQYQQRMARLTRVVIAQFTALKRDRGWVDMNDVERAALLMLADPVLSGWVQERLDARIRHLMIDEFQDTNPLQWQALYSPG
jgi:ATP-dependent helicase/nuclease subunit A